MPKGNDRHPGKPMNARGQVMRGANMDAGGGHMDAGEGHMDAVQQGGSLLCSVQDRMRASNKETAKNNSKHRGFREQEIWL